MAHEINNPLAGIIQNVQVMKNRMSPSLPKNISAAEECGITMEAVIRYMEKRELFKMIESVIDSGQRAARIVNNMLSFSQKSEANYVQHSLTELLDKTVELAGNDYNLKKKFDFKYIKIVKEYEPDLPMVYCEGSKIQQVFLNILKNGAEALFEYGAIKKKGKSANEIKVKQKKPKFVLRAKNEGHMIKIEIEDNGPGIPDEVRKRIFEPFFTTKPVDKGTGLGLSVSYFIITENHQGEMRVKSELGKGTKFIIKLPVIIERTF